LKPGTFGVLNRANDCTIAILVPVTGFDEESCVEKLFYASLTWIDSFIQRHAAA
jgi:hypothetical protein